MAGHGGARPNSGRPRGSTNKIPRELKELAREHTAIAISKLAEVLHDPSAPHMAIVKAAEALLDRGHGRPTQHVEARVGMIEGMTDEDLAHALAVLQAADERDADHLGDVAGHA